MSEQSTLQTRVKRIEREVRLWRLFGIIGIGCVTLVLTLGANGRPDVPQVLRAGEFQLVDDEGAVRASLKALGNGTHLRMYDSTKTSEISITANSQRAIVNLANDNRINSATIEAYASGGAVGLMRRTGEGDAFAQFVGGTKGTYVKLQPLKGEEVRVPSE